MASKNLAVGLLGGTIAMTTNNDLGLTPTWDVRQLVSSVPALADRFDLRVATLVTMPSASLSLRTVLDALRWARCTVESGADGVVLVQGTDTLEESAYLLDLLWDRPAPLVLTGATRGAQQLGSDGAANLWAAVLTASSSQADDTGVLVVMNDEVHAASRVTKADTMALNAFRSPVLGPVGRIIEGHVYIGNRLRHPLPSNRSKSCPEHTHPCPMSRC